jgi:GNAT superfamily N-acetyltransferase
MGFMMQLTGELSDVRIRPYGHQDREKLHAMSTRLTGRSLYLRFFTGTLAIPENYLRSLDRVDHWNHDALIATFDGEIVGIAEYVRIPGDPGHAEVATLVADEWQHRGLGRHLIAYLSQLAGRRGISTFDADVMLENRIGIKAVERGWPDAARRFEGGAVHFRLPLAVPIL